MGKVFDFFRYTPNIRHLAPFPFRVLDVRMPPLPEAGARTEMDVRTWGLFQRWTLLCKEMREPSRDPLPPHPLAQALRIAADSPPAPAPAAAASPSAAPAPEGPSATGCNVHVAFRARIIMQAEFSPFRVWVHTLTLREAAEGGPVELTDRVDYEHRSGVTSLLLGALVRGEMDRLYTFRQGRAKRILEGASKPHTLSSRDEESQHKANAVRILSENEVRFRETDASPGGDKARR